jgi:hypothetical protein
MKPAALVCCAILCGGCASRMTPPSPAAGSSHPPPRTQVEASRAMREIHVCVLEDGRLRAVRAAYDPAGGDTLYGGRPFRDAFPDTAGYAASERWYLENETISWERRRYIKYGLPRILAPRELLPGGRHGGVAFFIEAGTEGTPGIIYVPTRPGCEFQAYQWDLMGGGVRGR